MQESPVVQVISETGGESPVYHAGPAQFGTKLTKENGILAEVSVAFYKYFKISKLLLNE